MGLSTLFYALLSLGVDILSNGFQWLLLLAYGLGMTMGSVLGAVWTHQLLGRRK
ncbi:hypothetical protein [Parazoarcus communis]|jgi:hypothetical protein|uniref:hypothetical protein n=1 Tax=Parazoarcus communis TaxID=41977 RepID=UPI001401E6D4|nr:hypothetical protein [Parazoarcus communis]